jgi:hypothetical protein
MKSRSVRPWIAVLVGALRGGLCGVFVWIDQGRKHPRLPLSPLTAILGGAALGIIAVQVLWIRDLLRPRVHEPGSMIAPDAGTRIPGARRQPTPIVLLAMGLVFLGGNHAMAVFAHRIHPALIVAGTFLTIMGLAGMIAPRLLADPRRVSCDVPAAKVETWSFGLVLAQTLLIAAAFGVAICLWEFVY